MTEGMSLHHIHTYTWALHTYNRDTNTCTYMFTSCSTCSYTCTSAFTQTQTETQMHAHTRTHNKLYTLIFIWCLFISAKRGLRLKGNNRESGVWNTFHCRITLMSPLMCTVSKPSTLSRLRWRWTWSFLQWHFYFFCLFWFWSVWLFLVFWGCWWFCVNQFTVR